MPVFLFGGFSVPKYDTGGHRIGSLDIRVVKTFDVTGFFGQSQVRLHLLHQTANMAFRIGDPDLFEAFLPEKTRVALG